MLMFTLAISCLTKSNLPWFMNLTFHVPMQSITSHIHNWVLFLLWLHVFILSRVSSPVISSSILGTMDLGSSSFSVLSFCLFILSMGFSRLEYWSGLPFPSPVDHILSDLSTMTRQGLMNYGMRFVTLYRRQGSRPSPWKRNAKKQNGCLGRTYK